MQKSRNEKYTRLRREQFCTEIFQRGWKNTVDLPDKTMSTIRLLENNRSSRISKSMRFTIPSTTWLARCLNGKKYWQYKFHGRYLRNAKQWFRTGVDHTGQRDRRDLPAHYRDGSIQWNAFLNMHPYLRIYQLAVYRGTNEKSVPVRAAPFPS